MVRQRCLAYETTCISLAYQSTTPLLTTNSVMKGCASTTLCNVTSAIDTGTNSFYMTSTCCETDYCNSNRFSAVGVVSKQLQCSSCVDAETCKTPTQLACRNTNNQCVDVVTEIYNNGTMTNSSIKGCGSGEACGALLSYNTGGSQLYTQFQCCSSNRCNNRTISVSKPRFPNGIMCWGCNETGNNECAPEKQQMVKCSGSLVRCMEAFGPDRKTLKKGCCTEDLCSDTYPAVSGIPKEVEIQCCAGNLCNQWGKVYSCPEDYSAGWRLRGSPGLLLAVGYAGLLRIIL
ncbi:urokinase plasminogen activator surface receptor isoform X2 [Ambystoma mexicanum]